MRLLLCGALACLVLAGCEKGGAPAAPGASAAKLVTGRVDTAVVLQADPEYQKNAEAYLKEQVTLRDKYFEQFKSARESGDENKKKQIGAAYQDAEQKLNDKWNQKTNDFLKSRHDKLRAAAEAIAKDQKIDLVVVDSAKYPSVEYGATDITSEVLAKLQGGGAATPAPQETKK